MVVELLKGAALVIGVTISLSCLIVAFKLLRADKTEYTLNRDRTPGTWAALRGEIPTVFDGGRDYRIAAGLAVDRKTNTWKEHGKLSEEALAGVLRRSHRA